MLGWSEDFEVERRPNGRLVEAGEPAVAEKGLTVCEHIDFFVHGVYKVVQTSAVVHKGVGEIQFNNIFFFQTCR